jgi:hypothetical protein
VSKVSSDGRLLRDGQYVLRELQRNTPTPTSSTSTSTSGSYRIVRARVVFETSWMNVMIYLSNRVFAASASTTTNLAASTVTLNASTNELNNPSSTDATSTSTTSTTATAPAKTPRVKTEKQGFRCCVVLYCFQKHALETFNLSSSAISPTDEVWSMQFSDGGEYLIVGIGNMIKVSLIVCCRLLLWMVVSPPLRQTDNTMIILRTIHRSNRLQVYDVVVRSAKAKWSVDCRKEHVDAVRLHTRYIAFVCFRLLAFFFCV